MKTKISKKNLIWIITSLVLLAIALRIFFIQTITGDMNVYLIPWYNHILSEGAGKALSEDFYNYMPAYMYLLDFMTLFRWIPEVVAIKLISVFFDFVAAAAVLNIIRLKTDNLLVYWSGFIVTLFLPTVVVESGLWGQCDIIYTSFLLWSLFFILKGKKLPAVISFGLAISFKLQAAFFAPVFILLLFERRINFFDLFWVPLVYLISILPAWIQGRPLIDLLQIYIGQFDTYHEVSKNAPNPYIFLSNDNYTAKVIAGMTIAVLFIVLFLLLRLLKLKGGSKKALIYDAAVFTVMIPFLLPKMHERFFFAGGLFLLVLAYYDSEFIVPAVLIQISSLFSYLPFLEEFPVIWVKIGAVVNILVVLMLFFPITRLSSENRNGELFIKPEDFSKNKNDLADSSHLRL